jgi:DNA-binding CsgD family transcriptional regulator
MTLTAKQLAIIRLLVEGYDNTEIGAAVGHSKHVIKNYLCNIYDITGMSNRLELTIWYLQHESELRCNDPALARTSTGDQSELVRPHNVISNRPLHRS